MSPSDSTLASAVQKPSRAKRVRAEVVTKDDLPSLAASIGFLQTEIDDIGRKAIRAALPLKLKQGLRCLKARELYALEDPAKRGAMGGRPKTSSDSDQLSAPDPQSAIPNPQSFADWVLGQPLAKATAYDLMHAVEGLGLTHRATDEQLAKALQQARKTHGDDLSITKLKNLHLANKGGEEEQEEEEETNDAEAKAGEARTQIHHWITSWDAKVKARTLEYADIPALRELHEFLTHSRDNVAKRLKSASKPTA